jgi:hypothetical protein
MNTVINPGNTVLYPRIPNKIHGLRVSDDKSMKERNRILNIVDGRNTIFMQ